MKHAALVVVGLLLLSSFSFAQWEDAPARGLIPFWMNGGGFYTLLVFVNSSEEGNSIISLRFCDTRGEFCSDTTFDMHSIRYREQIVFSTNPRVPLYIPVSANMGYVLFRAEGCYGYMQSGGIVQAYALIVNEILGTCIPVPVCWQDCGF